MKIKHPDKFDINDLDTGYTGKKLNKEKGKDLLAKRLIELEEVQSRFYADGRRALLIILQGLDAAGKDSTIGKVFSGINPQGCEVSSFKVPTHEELRHDFLWRSVKRLPEQGKWGIFNRSYYEEVLVVRVHKDMLISENLPPEVNRDHIWKHRFEDINNFEKYLTRNGHIVIKIFLNVSKKEQEKRFLERAELSRKHWKVGEFDLRESELRKKYMDAINEMIRHTSTDYAPWYVLPADDKWYLHICVLDTILDVLKEYKFDYPKPTKEQMKAIEEVKSKLEK
jgi:PPK2 family polyphosphate:nucleotide phosphotransferase